MTDIIVNEEVTELTSNVTDTTITVTPEVSTIVVEPQTVDLTVANQNTEIQVTVQEVVIETTSTQGPAGPQGPQGAPGIAESEVPYASRVDFIGETLIYRAEADPGVLDSASLWRIRRLTIDNANDGDVITEWADGVADFTKVWDLRLTYTFT